MQDRECVGNKMERAFFFLRRRMEIQIVHILASFKLLAVRLKSNNHYCLEVGNTDVYQYKLFFYIFFAQNHS